MALIIIGKTFRTTITIDQKIEMPYYVARLNRSQLAEVDEGWKRWCEYPRGQALDVDGVTLTEDEAQRAWLKSVDGEQFQYLQTTIEKYVTLDEGVLELEGVAITNGEGLVRAFHSRRDVLRACVHGLRMENLLFPTLEKNSKSLSDSANGLALSTSPEPVVSGSKPGLIATNAEAANSAAPGDATAKSEPASPVESSGSPSKDPGPSVH